jgi:hypothetical protein
VFLSHDEHYGFDWQIDELEDKMFIIHGIRDPKKIRARRGAP